MKILAIDPGPQNSGYVLVTPNGKVLIPEFASLANEILLERIIDLSKTNPSDLIVVVEAASDFIGRLYNRDMALTAFWWGRFTQLAIDCKIPVAFTLTARDVRRNLCGTAGMKELTVKQTVIDHFGGNTKAIGGIRCSKCKGKGWFGRGRIVCSQCSGTKWEQPLGVLYEIKRNGNEHIWSALALAVTYADRIAAERGGDG